VCLVVSLSFLIAVSWMTAAVVGAALLAGCLSLYVSVARVVCFPAPEKPMCLVRCFEVHSASSCRRLFYIRVKINNTKEDTTTKMSTHQQPQSPLSTTFYFSENTLKR